jgi:hypothetical protein
MASLLKMAWTRTASLSSGTGSPHLSQRVLKVQRPVQSIGFLVVSMNRVYHNSRGPVAGPHEYGCPTSTGSRPRGGTSPRLRSKPRRLRTLEAVRPRTSAAALALQSWCSISQRSSSADHIAPWLSAVWRSSSSIRCRLLIAARLCATRRSLLGAVLERGSRNRSWMRSAKSRPGLAARHRLTHGVLLYPRCWRRPLTARLWHRFRCVCWPGLRAVMSSPQTRHGRTQIGCHQPSRSASVRQKPRIAALSLATVDWPSSVAASRQVPRLNQAPVMAA